MRRDNWEVTRELLTTINERPGIGITNLMHSGCLNYKIMKEQIVKIKPFININGKGFTINDDGLDILKQLDSFNEFLVSYNMK